MIVSNILYHRQDFEKVEGGKLKTAGWGKMYDKRTKDGITLTSCMTDHNGPQPYNFHPCVALEVIRLMALQNVKYFLVQYPLNYKN